MGIFDFIFGKKDNSAHDKKQTIIEKITQVPLHYRDIASENVDLIEGMQFHATCQLRTPLYVFKRHGEVFKGDGEPPTYGSVQDGCWVPKLKDRTFDFLDKGATCASDAGAVNAEEYVEYAIGLLSIFELQTNINEKMSLALSYSKNNKQKKEMESKILRFYGEKNIADVMARFISKGERFQYYFDKPGKLTIVNGVSKKIASALESAGVYTLKELSVMTESDLIKINGIGRVSAQKIISSLKGLSQP